MFDSLGNNTYTDNLLSIIKKLQLGNYVNITKK